MTFSIEYVKQSQNYNRLTDHCWFCCLCATFSIDQNYNRVTYHCWFCFYAWHSQSSTLNTARITIEWQIAADFVSFFTRHSYSTTLNNPEVQLILEWQITADHSQCLWCTIETKSAFSENRCFQGFFFCFPECLIWTAFFFKRKGKTVPPRGGLAHK